MLRVVALMLLLFPALASAGWRQVGVLTGTPQDVVVVDAGLVVATSTTGAFAWSAERDGGVTTITSMTGALVGAALFDGGCLVALDTTGNVSFSAVSCGTAAPSGASTGRRLRMAGDRLVLQTTTTTADTLRTGPIGGPWPSVGSSWLAPATHAMQTARVAGADFHVSNASTAVCQVSIDGGATLALAVPAALRDVSPFERQGAPAALGVTSAGALVLVPDLRVSMSLTPTLRAGAVGRFVGMTSGAGMITTAAGEVFSPLPDPTRDALAWRQRVVPAQLTNQVHCLDARWCAAIDSTLRVFLFENAVAPQLSVEGARADAGATVRLAVDAGDEDGDPLLISWSAASGVVTPVANVDDGFAVDLSLPPGAGCGPFVVDATASDGLHTTTFRVDVQIVGRGDLALVPPAAQPFAGGPPVAVSAFIDGGCEPATISWASSDGQSSSGATFTWAPPATSCSASGAPVTLTATASWGQGAPTTSQAQLVVEPWGAPLTPVFASPATQRSGTTQTWRSVDPAHACVGSVGFPGTELAWEPLDAGPFEVQLVDGGLTLTAPECVGGQLVAVARRQVVGEQRGRRSDAGVLVVDVVADVPPLDALTPFGVTAAADAGVLAGALTVTASCPAQRELSAEVTVFDGPTPGASMTFPVPGGWSLSSGSCEGGQREVVARLFEDGGFTGAEARALVDLAPAPVAVGPQNVSELEVRCGVGATARVELLPGAGTCGAVATSWRARGGPALAVTDGAGTTFELATTALDFSTVGQQVEIEWAVDGGGTNVASALRPIALTVAPFVDVTVRAGPAVRREEAPTWFEVSLHNTSACAVEGLEVVLPLTGAAPLLESVMLDDAPVDASVDGTSLRLEGVSLPADGTRVVRFGARARLLGTPSLTPTASLHGVRVSTSQLEAPVPPACGCSGAPGLGVLGLVLLVRARRRQRAS